LTTPQRRITQARRLFGPPDLAALERSHRRKLVQLLLTQTGGRVTDYQNSEGYDEIVLESTTFWRSRTIRARIANAELDQAVMDQLTEVSAQAGDAETILFAPYGTQESVSVPDTVLVIEPEEFIARLERCSMVMWENNQPTLAYERVGAQRELDRVAFVLDPVGLRWLPSLSRNEHPPELEGQLESPDTLFERMSFRMFTSCFRFGGERYGEARRGKRLPDAVLIPPGHDHYSVLMDCKASAEGYVMESDHYLRFKGYIDELGGQLNAEGYPVRYMLVVSSAFGGQAGPNHPFHARTAALKADRNVNLSYLAADILAQSATQLELKELSPSERENLDWDAVFSKGHIQQSDIALELGL
jgi:hypothetical protein